MNQYITMCIYIYIYIYIYTSILYSKLHRGGAVAEAGGAQPTRRPREQVRPSRPRAVSVM